jgi:putative addiction module component (TIGR02574 family)
MSFARLENLLTQALALAASERAELAARLIDSLDQSVDEDASAAWDAEIARRVSELDSGSVKPVPWPELRRRLLGRLDDASAA